jgi:hypothetical protein
MHMKRMVDRLLVENYRRRALGGHLHAVLENSLCVGTGWLAPSNANQVAQACKIIEGLGLEISTPDKREILELRGGDRVVFDWRSRRSLFRSQEAGSAAGGPGDATIGRSAP